MKETKFKRKIKIFFNLLLSFQITYFNFDIYQIS